MKIQFGKLIVSLAVPFMAGGIGSYFTSGAISSWYQEIEKASVNPPNFVFGPAWTLLYILMGVALYLVWTHKRKVDKGWAYVFFGIQILLNTFWSLIFFGQQDFYGAFVCIVVLWISILMTIIFFYRVDRLAAYLLVPYLLWVTFASYLNYMVWVLN